MLVTVMTRTLQIVIAMQQLQQVKPQLNVTRPITAPQSTVGIVIHKHGYKQVTAN
jgi:hypothetical protein